MHIMSPAAGKMRLNTRSAGICSTKRSRPDSVSRLTRMLVPNPKNAFQSPGTQSLGLKSPTAGPVAFATISLIAVLRSPHASALSTRLESETHPKIPP